MINSAQVSSPLRQVRIDVLQTKAIHQLCVSGFEESVPNHTLLLGSVVMTTFLCNATGNQCQVLKVNVLLESYLSPDVWISLQRKLVVKT